MKLTFIFNSALGAALVVGGTALAQEASAPAGPPTAAPAPTQAAPPTTGDAPATTEPDPTAPVPDAAPRDLGAAQGPHPNAEPATETAQPTASPAPPPEPQQGPTLELPPEEPVETGSEPREIDMLHGLKAERQAGDGTTIGGYGEMHYTLGQLGSDDGSEAELDLHRLVLFVAHTFTEEARFYLELEVEHAFAADGAPGEVEVEQAYVDYLLLGESLGLRAGLVLVPMGIINQWHEPPIFHGVERPSVDRLIIPTTWWEGGAGIFGEPAEGLRYELYVTGGLDAAGFSAANGLRGGRQKVAEAVANGPAVTGRVEYEPALGVVAGLSGYFGLAGPNAEFYDAAGEKLELDVPVWGVAADARGRVAGLEARAVAAVFGIGETAELRNASDADGNPLALDVAARLWGAYGELAYDVLRSAGTSHQLLPFVRVERYDTMADVQGRETTPEDEAFAVTELVFGLTYRPIPQLAVKSDFQLRNPDGPTETVKQLDFGVGAMF